MDKNNKTNEELENTTEELEEAADSLEEVAAEAEAQKEEDITTESTEVAPDEAQTTEDVETLADANQAMNQINLENLIKRYVKDVEKLKAELKEQSSMFKDSFENDPVYKDFAQKAQDAIKLKNGAKQQILKQPAIAALQDKIQSMKEEVKDLGLTLSDCLQRYHDMSGATTIEDDDGEVREIVTVLKLVKKPGIVKPKK